MARDDVEIEKRMPVWIALSDLFLDTELGDADLTSIASVLAASPYSEKKLEEILRFEVTPALKWNLMSVAGEWAMFDEKWLRETLASRIDHRPWFQFRAFWMVRKPWQEIARRVATIRATSRMNY